MMDRVFLSLGIVSFAFPQASYLSYLFAGLACIAYLMPLEGEFSKTRLFIAAAIFLAVTFLLVSAPFVTGVLCASSLIRKHRLHAVALITLQTSIADTVVALMSNYLIPYHVEAAAPGVLASLVLLCVDHKPKLLRWMAIPFVLLLAFIAKNQLINPSLVMLVSGLPAIALAMTSLVGTDNVHKPLKESMGLGVFIALLVVSWIITPPRNLNEGYFYLPDATNSPEYKYFENYQEVANFTGLKLNQSNNLKEIPPKSLVVFPWLTEKYSEEFKTDLKKLAKENAWTVLLVGEHTNMNGVADFVNSITPKPSLNDDLTTPPKNTDISGPLREGSVSAWRPDAVLNRGASVSVNGLTDKVILSGDGWWSEKDIGEWLWVGDYIWQSHDRNGRLPLAVMKVDGKARWLVLGDSTPFLNRVLLSDPRPAKMLLHMASLWPLFTKDALLLILAVGCFIQSNKKRNYIISLALVSSALTWVAEIYAPTAWDTIFVGQSTFDDKNFNAQLSKSKELLKTNWKLIRTTTPLNPTNLQVGENAVVFGLIDNQLKVDSVLITKCHRLGSIKTDEGPFLMDAQVCKVSGDVGILIGDKNEAAALLLKKNGKKVIVVLDQKFLAQQAPIENTKWLEEKIKRAANETQ